MVLGLFATNALPPLFYPLLPEQAALLRAVFFVRRMVQELEGFGVAEEAVELPGSYLEPSK